MDPPASGAAGGGAEDPEHPDPLALEMQVEAPTGGEGHMVGERAVRSEPVAQMERPAARGEPVIVEVAPAVTTAGEREGQAASAVGQRQPEGPVVNNSGAETPAPLLRLEPAAQPGAGSIVAAPSSLARWDYQPGTLARLSRQWDETNRAAVANSSQAAVATAGEPNSEQMHNLFQRASRDFAEAAHYAHVSFLSLISFGVFAWPYSLVP